ncbi:HNH endonuclease signature motif containing protein [Pseudoclavibacter sp. CFCC 11306]|uniref:HNH endonuclease signature motif containing protein n=1 Tax=Pseudoclavibacter sp. CFCC 11306 TaxID=1564493 RepID=UPI0013011A62|nr:HNH endonuclease signature motif containing protein [Pseudoclavibacter sp. CFCC 11306]KAB1657482.1 DUF222 domain-containing protein [Pseudoclavibacter sp. CFCC 11306]
MEATTHLAQRSQPDPLQALIALGRVAGAVGAQAGAPVSASASGAERAGTSEPGSRWGDLTGDALVAAVELVEHAGRAIDSLRVQVAGEVAQRCAACDSDERLSTKYGQRTAAELIEYVAGVSAREARRRVRLSEQLLGRTSDTGLPLPPLFAQVGAALAAGDLGVEAAEVIVSELGKAATWADIELLDAAECALVDGACPQRESEQTNVGSPSAAGDDDHGESGYLRRVPGLSADLVRVQARAWREALDPDGVQPREDEAVNRRDFWISSRLGGSALAGAASAGAASVGAGFAGFGSAEAALAGRCCGIGPVAETGSISGVDDPVPAQTIGRMACDGGTQLARLDTQGALVSLTTTQRVFSTHQRRAIAARDGHQCAIPGCRIPAHACEAHHVVPWQQGGKTHVGNGVLLCWWRHRHIDNGAWQITMCEGRPQIRPPQIRSLLHQTARRRR